VGRLCTRPTTTSKGHQQIFSLRLIAEPGVDGIRSFRALLRAALRYYGLRAIDAHELHAREPQDEPQPGRLRMSKFSERVQAQREEQKETGIFKVDDLKPNKELLLTIRHLDEQVAMFGKEVDLLNFVETGRQLQLNWTTSQWLIDNLGDDPEDWPSKQVVLYLGEYEYNREKKLGIRLKLPGTKSAAKEGTIIPPSRGDGAANTNARLSSSQPDRETDLDDTIPF
jgi:hypothetical protein